MLWFLFNLVVAVAAGFVPDCISMGTALLEAMAMIPDRVTSVLKCSSNVGLVSADQPRISVNR